MQVGCGFRVKAVKGQDYVYFWHYEDRGGRSRQRYEYIGPRRSPGTAHRLEAILDAYYARIGDEVRRRHAADRVAVTALRA